MKILFFRLLLVFRRGKIVSGVGVLALFLVLVAGGGIPAHSDTLPRGVYHQLETGDYRAAKQTLSEFPNEPETSFWRGWIAFREQEYAEATSHFKDVISRYDRDTPRYRDALYYLDRLKLYRPATSDVPIIRVRIAKNKQSISGTGGAERNVRIGGQRRRWSLPRKWTISRSGAKIQLTDRSRRLVRGGKLRIEGAEQGVVLEGTTYRGTVWITPGERGFDVINELPLNQYLYGVVKKELAAGWPWAVVRAQSVAARSFALYQILQNRDEPYDLSASWLSQVYGGQSAETPRIRQAVDDTRGEVLTHRGRIVPAYFHANSGGHIETPVSVWGGQSTPFIQSKKDDWSLNTQHSNWKATISRGEIVRALVEAGHPAPRSGAISLQVLKQLPSGRAETLQYASRQGTTKISANDFRMALGPSTIKSTWFDRIRESGSKLEFRGKGWGHGVGMSQWGARKMAESGHDYRDILSFYFEPAQIVGQYGPTHISARAE